MWDEALSSKSGVIEVATGEAISSDEELRQAPMGTGCDCWVSATYHVDGRPIAGALSLLYATIYHQQSSVDHKHCNR